jgi:uridine phosphorylase
VDIPLLDAFEQVEGVLPRRPIRTSEAVPQRAVMCFFSEVLDALAESGELVEIGHFSREVGGQPLYRAGVDGEAVAVFHPGVGAPLAVLHLEAAIASGCGTFVGCGGAGAVAAGLDVGHVVVADRAIRDEGTSFHYLPPSRSVDADQGAVEIAREVLSEVAIPHSVGATWTTDAPFRETRARIERRRAEGCLTVEMEAAALMAVAQFRRARFVQLLYAGDDLSGPDWSHRNWTTSSVRPILLDIALTAARRL